MLLIIEEDGISVGLMGFARMADPFVVARRLCWGVIGRTGPIICAEEEFLSDKDAAERPDR